MENHLVFNQWVAEERKQQEGEKIKFFRVENWERCSTEMLNCQRALYNSSNLWLERLSVHLSEVPDCWFSTMWYQSLRGHRARPVQHVHVTVACTGRFPSCTKQLHQCQRELHPHRGLGALWNKHPSLEIIWTGGFRRTLKHTWCVINKYEHFLLLPQTIMS